MVITFLFITTALWARNTTEPDTAGSTPSEGTLAKRCAPPKVRSAYLGSQAENPSAFPEPRADGVWPCPPNWRHQNTLTTQVQIGDDTYNWSIFESRIDDPSKPGHTNEFSLVRVIVLDPETLDPLSTAVWGGGLYESFQYGFWPSEWGFERGRLYDSAETVSDPITYPSGNLPYKVEDVRVMGPRGPFAFGRTYNCTSGFYGWMGQRWAHSYEMAVVEEGDNDVVYLDPDGRNWTFTYNGVNDYTSPPSLYATLTKDTGSQNERFKIEFKDGKAFYFRASDGYMTKMENRIGKTVTFTYSGQNRLTKITDDLGRIYALSYNAAGTVSQFKDFNNRIAYYYYDTSARLTGLKDFNSKYTRYYYDGDDRMTKVLSPLGTTILTNTYDTYDRVTKQNWDGHDVALVYTPASDKTEVTDREGTDYEFQYTSGDEMLIDQYKVYTGSINPGDPASFTRTVGYDSENNLTKTVMPDGVTVKFKYDATGNLTEARGQSSDTTPSGSDYVMTFAYDSSDDVTTITDELSRTTTYYYDGDGNRTKAVHPSVTSGVTQTIEETWAYNSSGQVTKYVDGEGSVTEYEFYTTGANKGYLQKKTVDPGEGNLAIAEQYEYDARGNRTKYTDPEGYVSNAWYDAMDRMTKSTSAANLDIEYKYDNAGNLTETKTETSDGGNGWYSVFQYRDAYGRVTKQSSEIASDSVYADTTFEYDKNGRVTKTTDPEGTWWVTVFDERGYTYQSKTGYSTTTHSTATYSYDGEGRTTKVVDALSNNSYRYYDDDGNLTKSVDALSNYAVYDYDGMGRVTMTRVYDSASTQLSQSKSYFDEVGRTYRRDRGISTTVSTYYYHDESGRITKATSPGSANTYTYYDIASRVTKATDARSKDTTFLYDKNGNRTTVTDPLSNSTTSYYACCGTPGGCGAGGSFACSKTGRLTKVVYADNSEVKYYHDILSRLTKTTGPEGDHTYAYYDGLGRATKATDAAGTNTESYYDKSGRLTKTIDALGKSRYSYYDDVGRLTKSTDPLGNYVTYAYDGADRQTLVTDPEGRTQSSYYDALGRMTKAEDGLGKAVATYYDGLGRTTKVTDPLSRNTCTYYDGLGRVTKTENNLSKSVTFEYDPDGRRTLATDANSKSSYAYYDAGGLVTKTTDAASRDVTFAYDDAGRRTGLTDASSHTTAFDYDKLGRLTKLTYPNSDAESYFFDLAGRMTGKTTPNTDTVVYAYSPTGLLTLKTYPGPATVTYSFDDGGRRTRVVDTSTDNSYLYDDSGRMTKVSDAAYDPVKEIAYVYDKSGARTLMDRPSGDDITYLYDARGGLTLLKEGASNRAIYLYSDAGERTRLTYGNSSYAEYVYNGAGNLTLLSNRESDATLISGFGYLVDDTGNRTKMEIDGSAYTSADIAYLYDDAYQLTSEVRTGGEAYTQTLCYDASGNRTKKTLGGVDTTYLYNTADQLTSETTGGTTTEYEYDANGALTKSNDGTTENVYTYDYDGYLSAFDTTGTDNDATYAYDAGKRRIAKTVDSTTTKYFLDGANVIADFDVDNVLQATYVTPGLDDNVSIATGGSTYYYLKDGLGSIRNLVDSNEATQNTYDYYAFGKELGSWSENVTNRYTYTGREYDSESEQYYYRARYYSGGGWFSRRDPRLSPRLYSYVSSRPVVFVDPTGRTTLVHWGLKMQKAAQLESGQMLYDIGKMSVNREFYKASDALEKALVGYWNKIAFVSVRGMFCAGPGGDLDILQLVESSGEIWEGAHRKLLEHAVLERFPDAHREVDANFRLIAGQEPIYDMHSLYTTPYKTMISYNATVTLCCACEGIDLSKFNRNEYPTEQYDVSHSLQQAKSLMKVVCKPGTRIEEKYTYEMHFDDNTMDWHGSVTTPYGEYNDGDNFLTQPAEQ
jgi:RHS repeat-associated protein